MAGTKLGGLKAAATNKAKYGEDYYKKQGAAGGRLSRGGGFAANRELAKIAGAKGGRASRKTKKRSDGPYEIHGVIDGISKPLPVQHEAIAGDVEDYKSETAWNRMLRKARIIK